MKKEQMNMRVQHCQRLNDMYGMLRLTPCDGRLLPEILPGQFVQILIPDSPHTFLRRPISVNMVDSDNNELWLLVRNAGEGTQHLIESKVGDIYDIILPLGNGFSTPETDKMILLVGGGVGVAPLLHLGKCLSQQGFKVNFALGARSQNDLLQLDEFAKYGTLYLSTEDGSMGQKGFVTQNSVFDNEIGHIACCGPTPMMKAVASIAKARGIDCEVSLENMMACGLGACLCCVEDTTDGNVCVCTEGPVFNINKLKWQI